MNSIRASRILLILFIIASAGTILISCRKKSFDGMIVFTQVAGKMKDISFVTGASWRYLSETRIVAFEPDKPGRSLKILSEGYYSACSPDISDNGDFMLFSGQKKKNDTWQIYEVNLSNLKIRQITSSRENCIDPAYLPGGKIVLSINYINDTLKAGHSLFTCNSDGSDMTRITFNPHSYFASTVLKDGRVLAISRQLYPNQEVPALMVLRPDGTKAELFYEGFPSGRAWETRDGKIVFAESEKDDVEGGNIISINYNRPLHSRVNLTTGIKGDFQNVFPLLSGKLLVSYRPSETERYALYEFDTVKKLLGNAIINTSDHDILEAVVVGKHERQKRLPSEVDMGVKTGLLLCQDINVLNTLPGNSNSTNTKATKIEVIGIDSSLGVIQVENDGSFYLKVKADTPFQIRTLDDNGRVLGQPCGWIWLRPNERRGCVGCHEDHEQVPGNRVPLAVKKLPVNVPVQISNVKEKKVLLE
jgi:hypothetical protein